MTLKVQLISDVHLEVYKSLDFIDALDPTDVDVLVVAGDLCTRSYLASALRALCAAYPHVVFVFGNHEYYSANPASVKAIAHDVAKACPNLHVLDNTVWFHQGVKFIGTTLWFRDHLDNAQYYRAFTDYVYIQPNGERSWDFINAEHRASMSFLAREFQDADVIVTHHVPSQHCVREKWRNSELDRFFTCDLPDLIDDASRERLWLFGHTHDAWDVQRGTTRLVANPRGYPNEQRQDTAYRVKRVIDVGR